MNFLTFLDNASFFNVSMLAIAFYLLSVLCFGLRFAVSTELAYPNLLPGFNLLSVFYLFVTFWFLAFDFDYTNGLFFFNQNVQFFFLIVACSVSFACRDFLTTQLITKFEYDILFLFVVLSALFLCFTDDFLVMYLAIELQSLAFYVFATFQRESEFSTESGLKYFLFGAVISCFLLLGFCFIYLFFGFAAFDMLFSLSFNNDFLAIGILFVLIALLFKVGATPFHFWLCDVYEGSMLSVTLMFAALPKIILFSLLVKVFLFSFLDSNELFTNLFFCAGLLSIAFGSISALFQRRVKRLFAYSTIAHTGFIIFGIVVGTPDSIKALVFYVIIYSLLTILLFSQLIYSTNSSAIYPKYLANWVAIGVNNLVFSITFTIILLSIAGIPPLAGFFSKFFILASIISQNYYLSAILIVILSSVACFYYIRLIKIIFFSETPKTSLWFSCPNRQNTELLISALVIFNSFFFIFPDFLCNISGVLGLVLI